jgi:hypothetical protein
MPPPDERGRPLAAYQESGPSKVDAHASRFDIAIVRHGGGEQQGMTRRGRLPLASASLYEPAADRTWWWLSIRCPHCGSIHLGRVRTESDAGGPRRAGCGRRVWVIVRRVYRSYASREAA